MTTQTKTKLFSGTIASVLAPNIFINIDPGQEIEAQQNVAASLILLPLNRGYNAGDPVLFTLDTDRKINEMWPAEIGTVVEHGMIQIRVKLTTGAIVLGTNDTLSFTKILPLNSKVLIVHNKKTITKILKV